MFNMTTYACVGWGGGGRYNDVLGLFVSHTACDQCMVFVVVVDCFINTRFMLVANVGFVVSWVQLLEGVKGYGIKKRLFCVRFSKMSGRITRDIHTQENYALS